MKPVRDKFANLLRDVVVKADIHCAQHHADTPDESLHRRQLHIVGHALGALGLATSSDEQEILELVTLLRATGCFQIHAPRAPRRRN